jgi:broad specificity phosphatase PhoE
VRRAAGFLLDVPTRWDGKRILIVGHVATKFALDQELRGVELEVLLDEDFDWQEGWEYQLGNLRRVTPDPSSHAQDCAPELPVSDPLRPTRIARR